MSPAQVKYIENVICSNSEAYYHQKKFYDYIGEVPYTLEDLFYWECYAMPWVTDRIRIVYKAGLATRLNGKTVDSRKDTAFDPMSEEIE